MATDSTGNIDALHATHGHMQSDAGCRNCRTFARVVLGYDGMRPHADMYCSECGTNEAEVYDDVRRLVDFVHTN